MWLCRCGIHKWDIWKSLGVQDGTPWWQMRVCLRCGKAQVDTAWK
jgi:hypothetical protein